MTPREYAFKAIETERNYQDAQWGDTASDEREGDGSRSLDEFALYIKGYTDDLVQYCSKKADKEGKLEIMRKIAALCVHAMERHGSVERK